MAKNEEYVVSVKVVGEQQMQKLISQLNKVVRETEKMTGATEANVKALTRQTRAQRQATAQMNRDLAEQARLSRKAGLEYQNASFQVQDFITQISGGQDALRALGQQLPQFLGAFSKLATTFPFMGAAIGIAAASIPLVAEIFRDSTDEIESFSEAVDSLNSNLKTFQQNLDAGYLANVAKQFGSIGTQAQLGYDALDALTKLQIDSQLGVQAQRLNTDITAFKESIVELAEDGRKGIEQLNDVVAKNKLGGLLDGLNLSGQADDVASDLEQVSNVLVEFTKNQASFANSPESLAVIEQLTQMQEALIRRKNLMKSSPELWAREVKALNDYNESIASGVPINEAKLTLDKKILQIKRDATNASDQQIVREDTLNKLRQDALKIERDLAEAERLRKSLSDTGVELQLAQEAIEAYNSNVNVQEKLANIELRRFILQKAKNGATDAEIRQAIELYGAQKKLQELADAANKKPDTGASGVSESLKAFMRDARRIVGSSESIEEQLARTEKQFDKLKDTMTDEQVEVAQRALEILEMKADRLAYTFKTSLTGGLEDAFGAMIDGTKNAAQAFGDMAKGIIADLAKMYVQMKIVEPLAQSLGIARKPAAYGTVVETAAYGTVLTAPTYVGRNVLAGEAGAEAIMPLRRLANGRLGVEALGGDTTVNVINNTNAQASVSERTTPGGGREIDVLIQNTVNQQLANGSFDRTMSTAYGLQRRGQGGR